MNKNRVNRPNNQHEPSTPVHSISGYVQRNSGWRNIQKLQEESDQIFRQMAEDSQ
jgi:hypothetical protein